MNSIIAILIFASNDYPYVAGINPMADSAIINICNHRSGFPDPWLSQDKFMHFYVSAGLCGSFYYLSYRHLNQDSKRSIIYSISLTALIGFSKEIYDKTIKKKRFSWKDIFWDGVGLAVGYLAFVQEF